MTKEEFDAYLATKEAQYGLRTGELRSIWQQESGGSIDTALKGPALSKGRGNAVGPMQVVPYYHPDFPANGTIAEQADYAAKFYAGLGKTPEERASGYYGRGVAPAGHPTTAQYASQVVSRLPQYEKTTPQETNMQPYTPLQAAAPDTEEERRRREMEYVQQKAAERAAAMQAQRQYDPNEGMMPVRELSTFEQMMTNPLTQMGAAMMASSGTDWGRAGGVGLMAANNAIYGRQQAENELWELQEKRKEALAKRRREERKDRQEELSYEETMKLADMYEARGDTLTAAQIRVGGSKMVSPTTAGMSPRIWTDGKKTFERIYKSDGSFIDRDMGTAKPATLDPTLQGTIAENKAAGTETGKANAEKAINAPKVIDRADSTIALIDRMLAHPGLDKAVGWASIAPTFPESDAAEYETMFNTLGGKNFLAAFESLKGGGAITEIEGQKATQAIAALSLKQKASDHRAELLYLKGLADEARRRAQAGHNVDNPYRGPEFGSAQTANPASPAAPTGGVVRTWNPKTRKFE